jgi:glutathione S-transferase
MRRMILEKLRASGRGDALHLRDFAVPIDDAARQWHDETMAEPVLVTITFSHFCEKARWALERAGIAYRESGHLPIFHALAVRRAGGWRSVPALVTDDCVINDSSNIMGWIDKRAPQVHLYGRNDAERQEIERFEDFCDEQLGPHTRRWAYIHLLPMRDLTLNMTREGAPKIEHAALTLLFPVARKMMQRAMKITPDGAERSRQKIDEVFADVEKRLADGRKFLVGDSLSAADITFASLAAVVVLPEQYSARLPRAEDLPSVAQVHIRRWREHPAGQFALRLFREHRR